MYGERREHQMRLLQAKAKRAANKQRFIEALLDGGLDLRGQGRKQIDDKLMSMQFDQEEGSFKYLTRMPMETMCKESVDVLRQETRDARAELSLLGAKTPSDLWLEDLDVLSSAYDQHLAQRAAADTSEVPETGGASKKKRLVKRAKKSA